METTIEARYAGVTVARSALSRESGPEELFFPAPEPLPVGTPIELVVEGRAVPARVRRVVESAEPGAAGMYLDLRAGQTAAPAEERPPEASQPAGDTAPRALQAASPSTAFSDAFEAAATAAEDAAARAPEPAPGGPEVAPEPAPAEPERGFDPSAGKGRRGRRRRR